MNSNVLQNWNHNFVPIELLEQTRTSFLKQNRCTLKIIAHALQVGGIALREKSVTKNDFAQPQARCAPRVARDNFFHRLLVYTLQHKKNWSKNILPAWRTIHSNAATDHAKWGKFDQNNPEKYFLRKFNENFEKSKFSIFEKKSKKSKCLIFLNFH